MQPVRQVMLWGENCVIVNFLMYHGFPLNKCFDKHSPLNNQVKCSRKGEAVLISVGRLVDELWLFHSWLSWNDNYTRCTMQTEVFHSDVMSVGLFLKGLERVGELSHLMWLDLQDYNARFLENLPMELAIKTSYIVYYSWNLLSYLLRLIMITVVR